MFLQCDFCKKTWNILDISPNLEIFKDDIFTHKEYTFKCDCNKVIYLHPRIVRKIMNHLII